MLVFMPLVLSPLATVTWRYEGRLRPDLRYYTVRVILYTNTPLYCTCSRKVL